MVTMVDTIDYHISKSFMESIFDSCKDITMQGGISVLKTAMCGEWGPHCNPERLFQNLGRGPPKGPAPFNINYKIWEQNDFKKAWEARIRPMNDKIDSCDVGVLVSHSTIVSFIMIHNLSITKMEWI